MTEERFKQTSWKMSYEEYKKCYCPECKRKDCPHREAFRRVPVIDGGLGVCPNLMSMVKRSMLGKIKDGQRPGYSYKGWKVIPTDYDKQKQKK